MISVSECDGLNMTHPPVVVEGFQAEGPRSLWLSLSALIKGGKTPARKG